MSGPVMLTERLSLRPFVLEDAERLVHLLSDARVAVGTLNIPHPYPPEMALRWLTTLLAEDESAPRRQFAIVLRDESTLIGGIGLKITQRHNHAEVGYWIGHAYWGRGYTTEALRAVVDYGFDLLGLHRIFGSYFARNPASKRVMEKCGMRYEGTLREQLQRDGIYEDAGYCGILREEWAAAR